MFFFPFSRPTEAALLIYHIKHHQNTKKCKFLHILQLKPPCMKNQMTISHRTNKKHSNNSCGRELVCYISLYTFMKFGLPLTIRVCSTWHIKHEYCFIFKDIFLWPLSIKLLYAYIILLLVCSFLSWAHTKHMCNKIQLLCVHCWRRRLARRSKRRLKPPHTQKNFCFFLIILLHRRCYTRLLLFLCCSFSWCKSFSMEFHIYLYIIFIFIHIYLCARVSLLLPIMVELCVIFHIEIS